MSTGFNTLSTDEECLQAWRRQRRPECLWPLVERHLPLVYHSALRRVGTPENADAVTRAVFLVLLRRAHTLRRHSVLPRWLFDVTAVAARKLPGPHRKRRGIRWLWLWPWPRRNVTKPAASISWNDIAPVLDATLDRLPSVERASIILHLFLNLDQASSAKVLRSSPKRFEKRLNNGLNKLIRKFRREIATLDRETLTGLCRAHALAPAPAESLVREIAEWFQAGVASRPGSKLARRTLAALAWSRWRRRLLIGVPSLALFFALLGAVAWHMDSRSGHSRLISLFLVWSVKQEARKVPGLAQPARPWPTGAETSGRSAAAVHGPVEFYRTTNIWLAHLRFSASEWAALEPRRLDPLPHFLQPDGTVLLRHPEAQRSGLAGVLGFDFDWTSANLELGGLAFTNVAVRIKGNGTFLTSLSGEKRSFKVDLNKFTEGQRLGEIDEFNFNNLLNDASCVSDGVPASRTAYAYLSVSAENQWNQKPLGLYVMVEPVDQDFALERFGSRRAPIFKPVTYELFAYLGEDWSAYAAIYDLKTKATVRQQRRLIDFAKLVTLAGEEEFTQNIADYLDLPAFARYLACEVLLSNYDSFLSNGQNFYLYLDPRTDKFGFIPWDLDLSWGGFFLLGSTRERERASIWHPWVGRHRLLERVMGVQEFQQLYRAQLEQLLAGQLVLSQLAPRIDGLAVVIRGAVAAESDFRLDKFEEAVGAKPLDPSVSADTHGANRPAHQIKRFIEARTRSVRRQLDGKSTGIILERRERR